MHNLCITKKVTLHILSTNIEDIVDKMWVNYRLQMSTINVRFFKI